MLPLNKCIIRSGDVKEQEVTEIVREGEDTEDFTLVGQSFKVY